ncbi:MAG TPA: alpha/beta hydrolase [Smithellaceae bacterium]|nr:alpha/beta hydrolase [Smithellaceae bacterium]
MRKTQIPGLLIVYAIAFFVLMSGCSPSGKEIEQKYISETSKFINIDGLNVHYRDEGQGPVLLCLHGIQSSLHTWDGWVKEMKNDYRIIRLDLPGWGFTGASNFGYQPDDTIEFLKKFVDALHVQKMNIAGNSYGGFLAWNFVVKHPDRVDKLIVIDGGGYPFEPPLAVRLMTAPVVKNLYPLVTPRFVVAKFVGDVYGENSRIPEDTIDRYYDLMMYKDNRKESVKFFETMKGKMNKESPDIKTIKIPTLILWGRQDKWIPISLMHRFKSDIPHARTIAYDEAGHIPMEQIPEITARDAALFLKGK